MVRADKLARRAHFRQSFQHAANHQTIQWLEAFAAGRVEPESALGQDIYLVSMDWYTQFVCHRLLNDLLADERARTASAAEEAR